MAHERQHRGEKFRNRRDSAKYSENVIETILQCSFMIFLINMKDSSNLIKTHGTIFAYVLFKVAKITGNKNNQAVTCTIS